MRLSATVRPHPTFARLNVARRELCDALGDPEISHRQIPLVVDLMALNPATLSELAGLILQARGIRDHGRPAQDRLPLLPGPRE